MRLKIFFFLILCVGYLRGLLAQDFTLYIKTDKENLDFLNAHVLIYSDSLYQKPFFSEQLSHSKLIKFKIPDSLTCFYTHISHLNYYLAQKKICKSVNNRDTITLYEKVNQLEEILITGAKKTKISINGNHAEISPGKIIQKSKVDASKLLKSIPDVFILPGNEIRIRGQEIETIFLYVSENSSGVEISTDQFSSIDVSSIEKIVTFYNERIIHVYLKKINSAYLFDNTLDFTQGRKSYLSITPKFSFKKENSTFWVSTNFGNVRKKQNSEGFYVSRINNQKLPINSFNENYYNSHYFKSYIIFEKQFKPTEIIGLRLNYGYDTDFSQNSNKSSNSYLYNTAYTNNNYSSKNFTSSAYYKSKIFKNWDFTLKTGNLLSSQNNEDNSVFSYNLNATPFTGSQYLNQRNLSIGFINELSLEKKFKLGSGLKFKIYNEYLTTKSRTNTSQLLLNNSIPDTIINHKIDENIIKFESQFQTKVFKSSTFSVTPTIVFYKQLVFNKDLGVLTDVKQSLFIPSFNLGLPTKEGKYLNIFGNQSFRAVDLRNYLYKVQSFDGFVSNENNNKLKPATYRQIGISYPLLKDLNASIYFNTGKDTYINYPLFSDDGVFLGNRKINLDKNNNWVMNLFYSKTILKKIFLSNNINISSNFWEGTTLNLFKTSFNTFLINQTINYSISDSWSIYMDFTYSSKQKLSENLELKSWSIFDMGFSKSFGKYFNLSVNLNNPFNSYLPNIYSQNEGIPYYSKGNYDYRYTTISLNYTFNRKFKESPKSNNFLHSLDKRIKVKENP